MKALLRPSSMRQLHSGQPATRGCRWPPPGPAPAPALCRGPRQGTVTLTAELEAAACAAGSAGDDGAKLDRKEVTASMAATLEIGCREGGVPRRAPLKLSATTWRRVPSAVMACCRGASNAAWHGWQLRS